MNQGVHSTNQSISVSTIVNKPWLENPNLFIFNLGSWHQFLRNTKGATAGRSKQMSGTGYIAENR